MMAGAMAMDNSIIFNLLQYAGGTFPGGGFSQSWSLETYVTNNRVKDVKTLSEFICTYLDSVIGKSEGPIVKNVMSAVGNDDMVRLVELEELSIASKLTKESREASLRMGNAFLRIATASIDSDKIADYYKIFGDNGISYSTAYGISMQCLNVSTNDAIAAYVFNATNAIIQSAVKLIPLGNTESQDVIKKLQRNMNQAVDAAMNISVDEIVTFCPGLDIAGMNHEELSTRLYMT